MASSYSCAMATWHCVSVAGDLGLVAGLAVRHPHMLLWLSMGAFASKLPALAEGGPGGAEQASSMWLLPPGEWLCEVVFV